MPTSGLWGFVADHPVITLFMLVLMIIGVHTVLRGIEDIVRAWRGDPAPKETCSAETEEDDCGANVINIRKATPKDGHE